VLQKWKYHCYCSLAKSNVACWKSKDIYCNKSFHLTLTFKTTVRNILERTCIVCCVFHSVQKERKQKTVLLIFSPQFAEKLKAKFASIAFIADIKHHVSFQLFWFSTMTTFRWPENPTFARVKACPHQVAHTRSGFTKISYQYVETS